MSSRLVSVLAGLALLVSTPMARAQTYTVTITSGASLGSVVSAASGDTVFDVAASTGTVSKVSGGGARVGSTSARALVQVGCSGVIVCSLRNVNIRVGSTGTPTRRARALTDFDIAMGTAALAVAATGTNPVNFAIGPVPNGATRTFYVGASFPIAGDDSGIATGDATSAFYAWAAGAPTAPSSAVSDTENFTASVFRPISISKNSDLSLGRLVKPVAGSGTVTIDAATGARSVSAGVGLATPNPTRAIYTVTGEGGRSVSISIPASISMSNGGSSLTLAATSTAPGTATLSNSAGSAGTYSFGVGGSLTLAATTASGAYSGVFNVTANYN